MGLFLNPRNARKAAAHLGVLRTNLSSDREDKRRVAAGLPTKAEVEMQELRELMIFSCQEPSEGAKSMLGWVDARDGVRVRQRLLERQTAVFIELHTNEAPIDDQVEVMLKIQALQAQIAELQGAPNPE